VVLGQRKESTPEISSNEPDKVVHYKISATPTMKEVTETKAKVREFIWEHWKLQKQGTMKFEGYSKEGDHSVVNYQIKCNENSACKLSVKIEREMVGRGKFSNERWKEVKKFIVETIDRVEIPKDFYSKRKLILENSNRSAKLYLIRLKNEKGDVVSEI
jgi:hypothetical protein